MKCFIAYATLALLALAALVFLGWFFWAAGWAAVAVVGGIAAGVGLLATLSWALDVAENCASERRFNKMMRRNGL